MTIETAETGNVKHRSGQDFYVQCNNRVGGSMYRLYFKCIKKNVVRQAGLNTSKQYNTRQRQKSNPITGNDQVRQQTIKNQQGNNTGIKTQERQKLGN